MIEITHAGDERAVAAARDLFREYQRELDVDLCFQGFQAELDGLPGDYAPPRGCLLLARTEAEEPVGCVALRPLPEQASEMKRLYVRPPFRTEGVGRRMVEQVIADARAIGYRRIYLDTLPVMAAAQRLYARLGFVDTAPYRENPVAGARFLVLEL